MPDCTRNISIHFVQFLVMLLYIIFTGELQEIRKVTLSKILCETLGLEEIQKDVFSLPDEQYV